jgi:hypothetical protein
MFAANSLLFALDLAKVVVREVCLGPAGSVVECRTVRHMRECMSFVIFPIRLLGHLCSRVVDARVWVWLTGWVWPVSNGCN